MSLICKLESNINGVDCLNPIIAGLYDDALLINYADIDRASSQVTGNIITDLVLKSGAVALAVQAPTRGIDATDEMRKGEVSSDWDQTTTIRIMDNSPAVKAVIESMQHGLFVLVTKNKHWKDAATAPDVQGDTKYEASGWYVGLELMTCVRNTADAETKGGWLATLGMPDKVKEPRPRMSIFKTSIASTETMIAALL